MRGVIGLSFILGGVGLAFLVLIGKFPPSSWNSPVMLGQVPTTAPRPGGPGQIEGKGSIPG